MLRTLAVSDHRLPRTLRRCRRWILNFSLPAPRVLTLPFVTLFVALRSVYYFLARVLWCEPFFKSYCTRYGPGLHTGAFLHYIQGRGAILCGENVLVSGKSNFIFAARYSDAPTLIIGDNSGLGHACIFIIGKKIEIGRHCRIGSEVVVFDSPGHPADPVLRLTGAPASEEEVKPVTIEDNVWIGQRAIIMPGITIGAGSIIASGAVVMANVPPNTMVAGNPARQVKKLVSQD